MCVGVVNRSIPRYPLPATRYPLPATRYPLPATNNQHYKTFLTKHFLQNIHFYIIF